MTMENVRKKLTTIAINMAMKIRMVTQSTKTVQHVRESAEFA